MLHIDAAGNETWIPFEFPGAAVTSANSIHRDRVVGIYTDDTGIHGYAVTIPGIYNPILNTEALVSDTDDATVIEGGPGDDVVNEGTITTAGDFNNAIRGDRYGVIYNYGTVTVSGATSGAVAVRGEFRRCSTTAPWLPGRRRCRPGRRERFRQSRRQRRRDRRTDDQFAPDLTPASRTAASSG